MDESRIVYRLELKFNADSNSEDKIRTLQWKLGNFDYREVTIEEGERAPFVLLEFNGRFRLFQSLISQNVLYLATI